MKAFWENRKAFFVEKSGREPGGQATEAQYFEIGEI